MRLFPRVIGGSNADTSPTMIDYYAPTDSLAIVGSTLDKDVAGRSSLTTKQAFFSLF